MKIKFKDGHKIKFKRHGHIWLAESVIWEKDVLRPSLDELRKLKAKIADWFDDNAPKKFAKRFNARLPLWKEIECLPFKDQAAYKEGMNNKIADYLLGDESGYRPIICHADFSHLFGRFCHSDVSVWACAYAVRLCLEEKDK